MGRGHTACLGCGSSLHAVCAVHGWGLGGSHAPPSMPCEHSAHSRYCISHSRLDIYGATRCRAQWRPCKRYTATGPPFSSIEAHSCTAGARSCTYTLQCGQSSVRGQELQMHGQTWRMHDHAMAHMAITSTAGSGPGMALYGTKCVGSAHSCPHSCPTERKGHGCSTACCQKGLCNGSYTIALWEGPLLSILYASGNLCCFACGAAPCMHANGAGCPTAPASAAPLYFRGPGLWPTL